MKRLFSILLVLCSLASFGQTTGIKFSELVTLDTVAANVYAPVTVRVGSSWYNRKIPLSLFARRDSAVTNIYVSNDTLYQVVRDTAHVVIVSPALDTATLNHTIDSIIQRYNIVFNQYFLPGAGDSSSPITIDTTKIQKKLYLDSTLAFNEDTLGLRLDSAEGEAPNVVGQTADGLLHKYAVPSFVFDQYFTGTGLGTDSIHYIGGGAATDTTSLNNRINLKVDSITFNSFNGVDTVKYWVNGTSHIAGYVPRKDGLISGGVVTWVSGLTFDVSTAVYSIGGVLYTSPTSQITLNTADATNDRIDLLAVNTSGAVAKITGTASPTPAEPQADPATQLSLTSIYVPAGSTVPQGVTQTVVYDENTEWTTSNSSGITVNFASTAITAKNGTKEIAVSSFSSGGTLRFTNSTTLARSNYTALKFWLYLTTTLTTQDIYVQFFNGNKSASNQLRTTFSKTTTGAWQGVSLDLSLFTFTAATFDRVAFTFAGSSASALYTDYVALQSGIDQGGGAGSVTETDPVYTANGVPKTRTISTTAPLAGGGDLSANRTLSITQATTSTDGYLSSTDWNTFNNKQGAISFPNTTFKYYTGYGTFGSLRDSAIASISLTTPNVVFGTPVSFSNTAGAWSGTMSLNSQSAYTVFGNHTSGSATPTFGKLPVQSIDATGTASSTTYLRGDGSWSTPSSSGGGQADSAYFWQLNGNAPAYGKFIGTLNSRSLRFRTNNTERMVIDSIGQLTVTSPGTTSSTAVFTAKNNTQNVFQIRDDGVGILNNKMFMQMDANDNLQLNSRNGAPTGQQNTVIGHSAGGSIGAANYNTVVGRSAAASLSTGSTNIVIGQAAGLDLTTGSGNIFVGRNSARGITTGSNNTIIGAEHSGLPAALSNTIILSSTGVGVSNFPTSRSAIIGGGGDYNNSVNDFYFGISPFNGSVGIGTHVNFFAPSAKPDSANQMGNNFMFNAGRGTGTGTPGDIIFKTSSTTTAGANLQTLSQQMQIKGGTGDVSIGTTSDIARLGVSGSGNTSATIAFKVINSSSNINFQVKDDGQILLNISGVPTYADDTAAGAGGLAQGTVYKSSDGILRIKL